MAEIGTIRQKGRQGKRTGPAADVVESELGDAGVQLEQERERLANATGSTEHSDLGELDYPIEISDDE